MRFKVLFFAVVLGVASSLQAAYVPDMDDPSPYAPTDLVAANTPGGVQIKLTWSLSPDDGSGANDVTDYKVYRRLEGDLNTFVPIGSVGAGVSSYFDSSGLLDGSNYEYSVRAVDAIVDGNESGAIQLNGALDHLNVEYDSVMDFGTGPFTVEAWIRLDEGNTLDLGSYPIISKGTTA
ncbi:MAG: hypothetical protein ACI84D_003542, partial [Thalassolituus oleivorans]